MLKPCPFCGCEAVLFNEFFDDYLVMCSNSGCAAEGPLKATSDEAETAWNTRLDAAEKRIEELELATPCPLLKSICEGWEFTVKLDKEEIIERYAGEIHTIRALDSVQLDTVKQLLSDLIDEVTR